MSAIKNLEPILKDLYLISGLNMSIFDRNYQLITSYPHQKSIFCSLIDKNPCSLKLCNQYDHYAFQKAKETGKIYIYQCYFHLYEAVVPLYHFGILSGYLMMGQTLTNSQFDREYIEKKALPYVSHQAELQEAITTIPVHTQEQIMAFASIVNICANYISLTHRMQIQKKDLAEEIKAYLHQYFETSLTISDLCEYFCCSRATLMNTFQKNYHQSIHQYLTHIRMKHAEYLLIHSSLSIQEIASKSGYQDTNYFTKAFRKIYHISPTQFRSHHKINM